MEYIGKAFLNLLLDKSLNSFFKEETRISWYLDDTLRVTGKNIKQYKTETNRKQNRKLLFQSKLITMACLFLWRQENQIQVGEFRK